MDSKGSSSSIWVSMYGYFRKNGVSNLSLRRELTQISHDIGHLFLLDEVFLLVVEQRKTFAYLRLEVLLTTSLLRHRKVVIPQHMLYKLKVIEIELNLNPLKDPSHYSIKKE